MNYRKLRMPYLRNCRNAQNDTSTYKWAFMVRENEHANIPWHEGQGFQCCTSAKHSSNPKPSFPAVPRLLQIYLTTILSKAPLTHKHFEHFLKVQLAYVSVQTYRWVCWDDLTPSIGSWNPSTIYDMNWLTHWNTNMLLPMMSSEWAISITHNPSFEQAKKEPSDCVLMSAWEAVLNESSKPWSVHVQPLPLLTNAFPEYLTECAFE